MGGGIKIFHSKKQSPYFIITIDTEGDNLWNKPQTITTKNAQHIPRFQVLCESYGFKPTYLVNFEMSQSLFFIDFGRDLIKREAGEIGMHLHAWNNPPYYEITENDYVHQPFLIEYPLNVMKEKVNVLTCALEDTFNIKMLSHRAGRWAFNEKYAKILHEKGYKIDCSVTPYLYWQNNSTVIDYFNYPSKEYFLNLNKINELGASDFLEVPMTVNIDTRFYPIAKTVRKLNNNYSTKISNKLLNRKWLRPNGKNIDDMMEIVNNAKKNCVNYIEFMLHSSELMPGGSPTFSSSEDIELLYSHLEQLFETISTKGFNAATLSEFYFIKKQGYNGYIEK